MAKKTSFVDLPDDGRSKYPAKLETIRLESTGPNKGLWVLLRQFDKAPSARDTASRLQAKNPDFEITSRGAGVYARWTG